MLNVVSEYGKYFHGGLRVVKSKVMIINGDDST